LVNRENKKTKKKCWERFAKTDNFFVRMLMLILFHSPRIPYWTKQCRTKGRNFSKVETENVRRKICPKKLASSGCVNWIRGTKFVKVPNELLCPIR